MRASDLHRAVSRATGESVAAIRRRGFSLLSSAPQELDGDFDSGDFDPGSGPIDWDALDAQRALPAWGGVSLYTS